ncbi:hypothetical protein [Methanococcoides alaskense]|uniref:Cytoskeletal protein CcmA (Bactofilin family) n=1 Tax=Methanococcoides alaskense TaxID=325778 RepID=A0AA90U052_9EURY|nr:hypothetical protein [Methanococcoides alaskense]MDA0525732.1 hypothetical protein [Methanococcoides alaskense]MDR6222958.1 cytoskeletal protein CcmA (bactofilin family) [Methanococcoides alaskense]
MKLKDSLWMICVIVFLLLSLTSNASASSMFESGSLVVINETVEDDVYIAGDTLIVNGDVLGDVVAAGGTVQINGNVSGDLIVTAGDVTITGIIGDDVRVACGSFELSGQIGDDLLVAAGTVSTTENANIGGDTTIRSGDADLGGNFGGLLEVSAGSLVLSGNVEGDAKLDSPDITIQPDSSVKGNLEYTTPEEIPIPAGVVGEDIKFDKGGERDDRSDADGIFKGIAIVGKISYYIFLFALGVMSILVFPEKTEEIAKKIQEEPLKKIAVGLLILIGSFIGAIVLLITIIGIPIALFLLLLLAIVLMIAKIYTAMWLGEVTFKKAGFKYNQWTTLAVGLLIVLILTEIPFVGGIIGLLVTLVAMGSMYFALKN